MMPNGYYTHVDCYKCGEDHEGGEHGRDPCPYCKSGLKCAACGGRPYVDTDNIVPERCYKCERALEDAAGVAEKDGRWDDYARARKALDALPPAKYVPLTESDIAAYRAKGLKLKRELARGAAEDRRRAREARALERKEERKAAADAARKAAEEAREIGRPLREVVAEAKRGEAKHRDDEVPRRTEDAMSDVTAKSEPRCIECGAPGRPSPEANGEPLCERHEVLRREVCPACGDCHPVGSVQCGGGSGRGPGSGMPGLAGRDDGRGRGL